MHTAWENVFPRNDFVTCRYCSQAAGPLSPAAQHASSDDMAGIEHQGAVCASLPSPMLYPPPLPQPQWQPEQLLSHSLGKYSTTDAGSVQPATADGLLRGLLTQQSSQHATNDTSGIRPLAEEERHAQLNMQPASRSDSPLFYPPASGLPLDSYLLRHQRSVSSSEAHGIVQSSQPQRQEEPVANRDLPHEASEITQLFKRMSFAESQIGGLKTTFIENASSVDDRFGNLETMFAKIMDPVGSFL